MNIILWYFLLLFVFHSRKHQLLVIFSLFQAFTTEACLFESVRSYVYTHWVAADFTLDT
jgi:hypothetical protein